jgi:XRE family transcriptional regulator, regulator of sulfur utilization
MSSVAPPNLGPLLNNARKHRGLTLETLATTSGVSRSMLSQIERGEASPTFSTLWNITQALGLTLADLNGEPQDAPPVDVQLDYNTPEITTPDKLCTLRILSPADATGKTEWYLLTLAEGGILSSDPHVRDTTEHLTVFSGQIEISSAGQKAVVKPGDTARYSAAVSHAIRNLGPDDARALLVVIHGESSI